MVRRQPLETQPPASQSRTSSPRALFTEDVLERLNVPLLLVSDERVLWANQALADLVGIPLLQLVGQPFGALVSEGGVWLDVEERPLRARAEEVALPEGTLVVLRPEGAPELPKDLLATRLAPTGVLASGLAHRLNNPLAYVMANLRFVTEELAELAKTPDPERLAECMRALDDAAHGAERVAAIVRDIKLLSTANEPRVVDVDIAELVDSTVSVVLFTLQERATVRKQHHGAPKVRANAGKLAQVLIEVLHNAAHALPEARRAAEGAGEIRITTRKGDLGWAVIEISDNGSGIAPEDVPRIFDPFFTTKHNETNVGLGLSIAQAALASINGRIEVDSVVGEGSTFRILLPPADWTSPTPLTTMPDRS